MANEDTAKEGVDFVWVNKGGYKTRKFLSSAEKAAKNAPAKPVVAAAKPKAKATATSPIPKKRPTATTAVRPEGQAAGMPKGVATAKVAGRGGYASGPAAGMPKAVTGGSNSTIVKYLKENNLDKKGVSLADILAAAIPAGITAAVAKVGYDKLKKDRAANTQGKSTPTKPSPMTTKTPSYKISEAKPLKSTATKPEGSKAKTSTTPKNLPPKLNYEDRITRDIKVRADTVARATKANAAADENIKAKAANVARVKAEAATRSAAASKVSADKAARIARAKVVTDKADAAAKARRENIAKVKAKAAARGAAARGGSADLTRGVGAGTGGFGSAEAVQRALNPLNLAKGGLITKKKK